MSEGVIEVLRRFYDVNLEGLQALQSEAEETVKKYERVKRAKAEAEAESAVALQGAASTNQAGATSGGPSTPDGGRGVQTDPLSKMKDQILQGLGRK
jgi:hypothetical protein